MKRFYAVAFLCFSSFMAAAQIRPLTLNEAIATSLQNNYDIQLLRNDSSFAALDYAYANYSLYPRLVPPAAIFLTRETGKKYGEMVIKEKAKQRIITYRPHSILTGLFLMASVCLLQETG